MIQGEYDDTCLSIYPTEEFLWLKSAGVRVGRFRHTRRRGTLSFFLSVCRIRFAGHLGIMRLPCWTKRNSPLTQRKNTTHNVENADRKSSTGLKLETGLITWLWSLIDLVTMLNFVTFLSVIPVILINIHGTCPSNLVLRYDTPDDQPHDKVLICRDKWSARRMAGGKRRHWHVRSFVWV